MKILFIAYQFPPLNVGGSQRPLYFAKYLPQFGIEPVVVTLDPEDFNKVYPDAKSDTSLTNELPKDIKVVKISSGDLLAQRKSRLQRFISIYFNIYRGSEGSFWKKSFFEQIPDVIVKEDIKAIFVTAPPFGILPLAANLAKRTKLPLIVDMRDPWTLWVSNPYPNYLNYLLTKNQERRILKMADAVIATSKQTIEDFKKLHPSVKKNKFHYIPNGFDQEVEFDEIKYIPGQKIKIGYVGSFYYSPEAREAILQPSWKRKGHRMLQYVPRKEDWLYRSPYFFFKTISALIEKNPKLAAKIEIHFAGQKPDWLVDMVEEFGLTDQVIHHGFLNHEEVLCFQQSCDFLLLTSAKVINGKDYSIAGKTFEYLIAQKPILAFVCEGAQKDLLAETGMSIILDPDRWDENVEKLDQVFIRGIQINPVRQEISKYSRKHNTRLLANVLDRIIK